MRQVSERLTYEDLHRGQRVVLPVHILCLVLRHTLLGAGADGVELVPLLHQLLGGWVGHLEGLAREGPVQAKRTQDHWEEKRKRVRDKNMLVSTDTFNICYRFHQDILILMLDSPTNYIYLPTTLSSSISSSFQPALIFIITLPFPHFILCLINILYSRLLSPHFSLWQQNNSSYLHHLSPTCFSFFPLPHFLPFPAESAEL